MTPWLGARRNAKRKQDRDAAREAREVQEKAASAPRGGEAAEAAYGRAEISPDVDCLCIRRLALVCEGKVHKLIYRHGVHERGGVAIQLGVVALHATEQPDARASQHW